MVLYEKEKQLKIWLESDDDNLILEKIDSILRCLNRIDGRIPDSQHN